VEVRIDDGRNYVLATRRTYDVIQPGIIHPAFSSGNAGFYTLDFYENCKRFSGRRYRVPVAPAGDSGSRFPHAGPDLSGGLPHTTVWYKWTHDSCVLIGTQERLAIDWPTFSRRAADAAVEADLEISHARGSTPCSIPSLWMRIRSAPTPERVRCTRTSTR